MEADGQIYGERVNKVTGERMGRSRDREVLFLLPDAFVDAYVELFWNTFKESNTGTDYKRKGESAGGGSGVGGGKKYRDDWLIKSEKYFRLKSRVDEILMALVREMGDGAKGLREIRSTKEGGKVKESAGGGRRVQQELQRCRGVGCGRFMSREWVWCPFCGWELSRDPRAMRPKKQGEK